MASSKKTTQAIQSQAHVQLPIAPELFAALLEAAELAKKRAYAPYSKFHVGAALLGESLTIYTGCNVENRSYGLTICAERHAVGQAISAGERQWRAIVIVTDVAPPAMPCGACRAVLAELAPDLPVIVVGRDRCMSVHTLADLLPANFVSEF